MKKIKSIKKIETNRYYDPEKVNNGGGYSQPLYNIYFDDGNTLYVLDNSCGEFGTRYNAVLNSTEQGAIWGTMQKDNEWSNFTNDDKELIDMVEEAIGIRIPTKEEIGD